VAEFNNFTTGSVVTSNIGDVNVLNNYRSYTYNFTLSAITAADLNDSAKWRSGQAGFIILQSGGKGTTGINSSAGLSLEQKTASTPRYGFEETEAEYAARSEKAQTIYAGNSASTISGFNKSSPGRFDMFIDKVEMNMQMIPTMLAGTTLYGTINFTIVEPYSINGFIEALHAASLAAGYYHYTLATFMLSVKFMGYPDGPDMPSPEEVPTASRSFPISIQKVKMEITEKGTIYRVTAVQATDRVAADSNNILKKAITFEGTTVQDALSGPFPTQADYNGTSFIDRLNEMQKESAKDRAGNSVYNEYRILFPDVDEETGKLDYTKVNKIGKTNLVPPLQIVDGAFTDVADTTQPTAYQNVPGTDHPELRFDPSTKKVTMQFPQDMNITKIIENTIRDSEYINSILKNVKDNIDKYGFIDWFILRLEIETTKEINPETQLPKQIFKYIVTPYKVHYTSVSILQPLKFVPEDYKKSTIREYNYIYTGKNVDIINFKMNFDSQFFQAVPFEINNDVVLSATAAGPGNSNDVTKKTDVQEITTDVGTNQNAPTLAKATPAQIVPADGPGGNKSDDPYRNLSRFVHFALLNVADKAQAHGEIEILGDPLYFTAGATGNHNPLLKNRGITTDGEAAITSGQALIRINFRNPIDILPFNKGGLYEFNEDLVPFSGIYLITGVNNIFSEGVFKQRISIQRMAGQVEPAVVASPQKTNNLQDILKQSSNPDDQSTKDSTDAKPVQAGQVSADVLKRLGVAVQTNLGTAATAVAAGLILKSITGKNSAAIAGAIVAGGGLTVAKNLLVTASSLGSTPIAKLVGGSGAAVAATSNVAPSIPEPNSIQSRAKDGVAVELLDTKTITNLPPSEPKSTAPDAAPDRAMLETIAKEGGPQALAKAYGVKDVSQISADLVPPDILKTALAAAPAVIANPFDYVKKVLANTVDTTVITNKIESASKLVAGVTTVNIIPKDATQVTSVGNQFGSNSSGNGPLDNTYIG
jgi:hypothetical protein